MLTKLTLGEKLKDLRIAKSYKSTEQLASVEQSVVISIIVFSMNKCFS